MDDAKLDSSINPSNSHDSGEEDNEVKRDDHLSGAKHDR